MEKHRFFASADGDGPGIPGLTGQIVLDAQESHHAIRVLRLKPGEAVELINGRGWVAQGRLQNADPKKCLIEVLSWEEGRDQLPAGIHIAIAPPKNMARFEWFLEKATEIGISQITPIQCQRSERLQFNQGRMEKVIHAALKQSLRTFMPQLSQVQPITSVIEQEGSHTRLMAHLDPGRSRAIKDVYSPRENVTVLIGPEGDFSMDEIRLALSNGYHLVSIGGSRLRTETAALMSCAVLNMINGQL